MASSAPTFHIKTVTPVNPADNVEELIRQYRELRLDCLLKSPEWFSSTHKEESQLPDSEWLRKISDPGAICNTAVLDTPFTTEDGVKFEAGTWVGTLTVIGPIAFSSVEDGASNEKLSPYLECITKYLGSSPRYQGFQGDHYHAIGMYVKSEFRQRGLGPLLINSILDAIRSRLSSTKGAGFGTDATSSASSAAVSLVCDEGNMGARKVYKKVGFAESELFDLAKLLNKAYEDRGMEKREEQEELMCYLMDRDVHV